MCHGQKMSKDGEKTPSPGGWSSSIIIQSLEDTIYSHFLNGCQAHMDDQKPYLASLQLRIGVQVNA